MNILVLNWQDITNPLGGGAEVHLHEIFKRVVARGHSVTLLCSEFSGCAKAETIDGIRIVRHGSRNLFNFHLPSQYSRLVRESPFDVVVDDLNKIPFYTPLYVREPLVVIVHHLFGKSIFLEANLPSALYVAAAERLALRVYRDSITASVSESTRRELISKGFREELISLVPNCVDHQRYHPVQCEANPHPRIGYLGRIKKYKSIDHLLQAFKIIHLEMPGAVLTVVGDGDARPGLEQLAQRLGISRQVEFTGFVPESRKVELLNQMDVVANPSSKEGWGLTVIEANACRVPVVASDVPGLRDSVRDAETGFLYEYGNIEQLAEKLLLVLRDGHLRETLAEEAYRWSLGFDWEVSADKMIEVMEAAIRAKTSSRQA
ncbi:MAG: glycosyltransferase family 4 protein [Ignavibacteria bacterium]|nr:glycosyltransferase family 4 protein [Ignavibacteria bacterium]